MKYYKDSSGEIYAYMDNEQPLQSGLTLIDETELSEILNPQIDTKAQELIELNSEIEELEELIKKALIIGNNGVIESLQKEYRSLLKNKEVLSGNEAEDDLVEAKPTTSESYTEPITVAPTDHL